MSCDSDMSEEEDEIFEENNQYFDTKPNFDDEADETKNIELFSKYLHENYDASPAFFFGSLTKACDDSFRSLSINERRPVLVYLHDNDNSFTRLFCSKILCWTRLIEYLMENYLVWPWNVTSRVNRTRLTKMWKEIFNVQLTEDFFGDCPKLIGIMRCYPEEKMSFSSFQFQSKLLFCEQQLMRLNDNDIRQQVMNKLRQFTTDCLDNEKNLDFDFGKLTGFSPDIMLKIAEYLSFNDAIKVFANNIVPLLQKEQTNLHLVHPSSSCLTLLPQYLNVGHVKSLCLDYSQLQLINDFSPYQIFNGIISLIIVNMDLQTDIGIYLVHFPGVFSLSLWFMNDIRVESFQYIPRGSLRQIKRLNIRCAGTSCGHLLSYSERTFYEMNSSIEEFIFDSGSYCLSAESDHCRFASSCFLTSILDFLGQSMYCVKKIRFITNEYQVEKLLSSKPWENLLHRCLRLSQVKFDVSESFGGNETLIQRFNELRGRLGLSCRMNFY